ncbi:MAG: Holliday junction branch migration protein RuvA [Lachnospiraceae bacterium]|nr:Holliday junction branch migration protein RuvA [Lachnospiraceae bacterium]
MIAFVKGELADVEEDYVIIENNGIGYRVFVPGSVASSLPGIGADVKLHTYLHVREEIFQLFGFLTKDELSVFKMLISVSGIGPKGALGILTAMTTDELRFAVFAGDAKAISKAPGIGAKTAQRLVIELKDKLKLEDTLQKEETFIPHTEVGSGEVRSEATQALVALGYSPSEAAKAVKKVTITEDTTVEDVLKQALKQMMF